MAVREYIRPPQQSDFKEVSLPAFRYMQEVANQINAVQTYSTIVNVMDYGAKGDSHTDDTVAIQTAFDASPDQTTIFFPRGRYKVTKRTGQDYCLILTKNKRIEGVRFGESQIRGDMAAGDTTTDILKVAITDSDGAGDIRNFAIINMTMFCNANGRHAVHIARTAISMLSARIEGCLLMGIAANNGRAIYTASENHTQFMIHKNTLEPGVTLGDSSVANGMVADGNSIMHNLFFGTTPAIIIDAIFGAYTHIIEQNIIVNRDGAIRIENGSQVKIRHNQIEHGAAYPSANTTTESAHIVIVGSVYESDGVQIVGNNFGGGSWLDNCIYLGLATETIITRNRFHRTNGFDVVFTANASHNRLMGDNYYTSGVARTDSPLGKMIVSDSGDGNMGFLKTVGGEGLWMTRYHKCPVTEDIVIFDANGGVVTAGTILAYFQEGFFPLYSEFYPATCSDGSYLSVETNHGNGRLSLKTAAGTNAHVAAGVRFPSKRGVV